jgi:magnesium transporter
VIDLHSCTAHRCERLTDLSVSNVPADVTWIDLLEPDAGEAAFVERMTGLHVPTLAELSEIESSSRLYTENDALYLSTPLVTRIEGGNPETTQVGFVLTATRLITVRYKPLRAFDTVKAREGRPDAVHPSSVGAFVTLVEAIVDRIADVLELVGAELDAVSKRVFRSDTPQQPAKADADLRGILYQVGKAGDLVSRIRDSLLGIGRMVPYVAGLAEPWLPAEVKPHLATLRQDVSSLGDYDAHLANKIQFLLDATLGLINIEQNNIIKVLTVVSVVGVPPTFLASMYGMNFKNMPELEWAWGYPYVLVLILISAIGPYLWFKWRGWL